jgi:hypothetical protein
MGADAAGAAPAGEELTAAADSPLPTPRTPPALPGVAVPADEPGDTTGAPPTVLDVESSTASRPAAGEIGEDPEGADDISDDSAPVADSVAPGDGGSAGVRFPVSDVFWSVVFVFAVFVSDVFWSAVFVSDGRVV